MSGFVRRMIVVAVSCVAVLVPRVGLGQAVRTGRLIITVTDPMGAVLPGAPVTVVGLEDATKRVPVPAGTTTERGVATFDGLVLGRYTIKAEFGGFDAGVLKDVRVRAGDNRQSVSLPLRHMSDEITVGQDKQEGAADRSMTFGTALTREQIDALSDDPAQMRQQLMDMAGPDAVFTVDSFEGQQLPSKAQIKSVRISRDQFAAETHFAGAAGINIVTQPGVGPLRGFVGGNFYNSALDGRNPLVAARAPNQNRSINLSVYGTAIPQKLGISAFLFGTNNETTPTQCVATPTGKSCFNSTSHTTATNLQPNLGFEYALTKDQVLSGSFYRGSSRTQNVGIGDFNRNERAYTTENTNTGLYASLFGPIGRRFVLNTRLSWSANRNSSQSLVEQPTIVVLDVQTTGGAQRAGGSRSKAASFGADLDYVRGRHSFRTGVQLDASWFRSDSASNYLGTFTFESLEAFEAGRPRSFTRQVGDPLVTYSHLQAGLYLQDDIRLRKNLTISPGLRYEVQTHLKDVVNLAPRFGVNWAPFAGGQTTLRGSVGIFYDWFTTNLYQQTLLIDGFHQRELNISNPTYPDPGVGAAAPTNKYIVGDGLKMPRTFRVSAGINQRLNSRMTLNVLYGFTRGRSMFVGHNLNAPIDGVRPDPLFANVIEVTSAARTEQHSAATTFTLNLAGLNAGPQIPGAGKLIDWRRGLTVNANHNYGKSLSNSDGAFATPATDLESEWGPAGGDIRHRGTFSLGTAFLRNFNARFGWTGNSAPPLNIRTGVDNNGDLIFNDRPAGTSRNAARSAGQWNTTANFSYGFTLGSKTVNTGGGVSISGSPGSYTANILSSQNVPRYRLNISVSITNVTNHANYTGYSGVITSQFFRQPTGASGVRRVTFNTSVSF